MKGRGEMNPWFETIFITIIAILSILLARAVSNCRRPWIYWVAGYFLPIALVATLVIARYCGTVGLLPSACWFLTGRIKFVILTLAVTIGLTAPMSRLSYRFEKAAIRLLMIIVVSWFCIAPFLVPVLIKNHLANLPSIVDSEGTCFQSKDYTCGPAAAVTALGKLGITANEGELAILAHSNPITGTLPWCLYSALKEVYEDKGLNCRFQHFDSIEQLKNAGITLTPVKNELLSDHCVAVLEVSEKMVTFADPVLGKTTIAHDQFEQIWRFSGIVLKRQPVQNI